jgi:membrane protease YdiL (CAAX protease family)
MATIFDSENPLSDQEMLEVKQFAEEHIGLWRKRSIYSPVALLLSCATVYPFLKGHPLHEYWEPFGKYLVLLSMAMLVVLVLCIGFFCSAWQALQRYGEAPTVAVLSAIAA